VEHAREQGPQEDAYDEIDRLLRQFARNPDDDLTFGRLEALLRGRGRWEVASDPEPPSKSHPEES